MKSAAGLIMFAAIAAVQCGLVRQGRQGWPATSTTTPMPAPGWPAAPSNQGWGWPSTTTPTQGWGQPPAAQGWGQPAAGWASPILSSINLNAALAAAGQGQAAETHADSVQVAGNSGWGGPSAQLVLSSNGDSVVGQNGNIVQVSSQDNQSALSLNNVSVDQVAAAEEGQAVDAVGSDISNAQSGAAFASGEGASAADAESDITVQPVAASYGWGN